MANLTIEGRKKAIGDIQRTWMYEVSIPNIGDFVPNVTDEGLTIRTQTAVIPGRTNEPIESVFMGTKQQYPGKETFTHTIDIQYEESEDQYILKSLYGWKERIFTVDPDAENAGSSQGNSKRDGQSTDIFIRMYRYNQDPMEKIVRLWNAWPAVVADVPLDYNDNAAVKYSVTFEFDFWTLL